MALSAPSDRKARQSLAWAWTSRRPPSIAPRAALAAKFRPLEDRLDEATLELCARPFPVQARRADFADLMVFVLAAVRGASLVDATRPGSQRRRRHWRGVRARLLRVLRDPT